MITITPNADGRVMRVGYADKNLPKGAIEVKEIPTEPTLAEAESATLYYVNGALVWRVEKVEVPTPPSDEPTEPPSPKEPTAEDLAEARRLAYEAEADRYLIAMHGYEVEGKAEEAENCRKAYLAKKAEIRKRFASEL